MLKPVHNFDLLTYTQMLLKFLSDIISVEANKMTLSNVAMIIAPNLFYISSSWPQNIASARRVPKSGKDIVEVSKAAETSNVVQLLIHYRDLLWRVCLILLNFLSEYCSVSITCNQILNRIDITCRQKLRRINCS